MGSCFGRCFPRKGPRQDEESLFEDDPTRHTEGIIFRLLKYKPKSHSRFLTRFWNKKDLLYARLSRPSEKPSSSNINMQCLDARSLMMLARDGDFAYRQGLNSECTSNCSNSLDLEWEHEYNQEAEWLPLPKDDSETASNYSVASNKSTKNRRNLITRVDHNLKAFLSAGQSPGPENSRRSTPDSLEWDRELIKSEAESLGSLDYETKELLNEIEQLKNRVLSETGDGLMAETES